MCVYVLRNICSPWCCDLADHVRRGPQPRQAGCLPSVPLHACGHEAQQAGHLLHGPAGPKQVHHRGLHQVRTQGACCLEQQGPQPGLAAAFFHQLARTPRLPWTGRAVLCYSWAQCVHVFGLTWTQGLVFMRVCFLF